MAAATEEPAVQDKVHDVDASTLREWLDKDAAVVVDVREAMEYAGDHLPGAMLAPLSSLDPQALPRESDRKLVLYCASGIRSARAASTILAARGGEVWSLKGGITAWKQAGHDTGGGGGLSLQRQVFIVIGLMVIVGLALGVWVEPWLLLLSAFAGLGLVGAGLTGVCPLAMLVARMPWNNRGT
jgi:rhodanese-related sulfurtransferase